jgi:SAM-dependent methyltransferase
MKYAERDITAVICPCWDLSRFETSSIDFVFASNLLEHLTSQQAHETLSEVNRVLKPSGIFGVVGPNYYYCSRIYWDDFTHRLALSHRSLASMLEYSGFKIIKLKKKFLPFSIRDAKLPIKAWMVRAYLISPLKPFGRQMYLLAEKE